MEHPTLCRIEYWYPGASDWKVGHSGVNLLNPAKYVKKLGENGHIARLIETETGNILYGPGAELL